MKYRAKEGAALEAMVREGRTVCRQAERERPRRGRGRRPVIPDWVLALMIMVAVMRRKKTKSAQYTFWTRRRRQFRRWMLGHRLPARSTFFERYRRVHGLFEHAIRVQGLRAIERGWADPTCVAVDKSLVAGRGPNWSPRDRRRGHIPKGVDTATTWGYSEHDGWVQGYAYEVIVTASKGGAIWPLLASVDTASRSEQKSVLPKLPYLPKHTRFVLADAGYDSNQVAEVVEWQNPRRRTGRRFLCPAVPRPNDGRGQPSRQSRQRRRHRELRDRRLRFLRSSAGRRLYSRRKVTVEPFHAHLKHLFELEDQVWHRGLDNNRTLLLAAMLAYQVLLAYNHRRNRPTTRLQEILDAL
jgi:hypothetical protein